MKIKLEKIWVATSAFRKLFNTEYDDIKLSYALAKIAKKINAELDGINEERKKLLTKYAVKKGKDKFKVEGGSIALKDPKAFEKKWLDLLNVETEIDVWKIPVEAVEQAKLTPNQICLIEDFVGEEKNRKKVVKK